MDAHYTAYYSTDKKFIDHFSNDLLLNTFILSVVNWKELNPGTTCYVHTSTTQYNYLPQVIKDLTVLKTEFIKEYTSDVDQGKLNIERVWAAPKMYVYKTMPLGDVSIDTDLITWVPWESLITGKEDLVAAHLDPGCVGKFSYNAGIFAMYNKDMKSRYLAAAFEAMFGGYFNETKWKDAKHDPYMVCAEQATLYDMFHKGDVTLIAEMNQDYRKHQNTKCPYLTHIWGYKGIKSTHKELIQSIIKKSNKTNFPIDMDNTYFRMNIDYKLSEDNITINFH